MIYVGTQLLCKDNSGALIVKCIGINKSSVPRGTQMGWIITVSVKTCLSNSWKIQKSGIHHAVIIRMWSLKNRFKKSGESIRFGTNSVVLISKKNNFTPVGNWVFGPVSKEVRSSIFMKVVLLSSGAF